MAITAGLRSLLAATNGITSLLATTGSIVRDKINQGGATPYINISLIDTENHNGLAANLNTRMATVDIDCVAEDKETADGIADEVEDLLDPYTGTAGSHTIQSVVLLDRGDDEIPRMQGTDKWKFITTVQAEVTYY